MSNQPQVEIISSIQAVAEISSTQVATEILTSTAPKIVELNVQGPQGPQGPPGPVGPQGSSQLSDLTDVNITNKVNNSVLYYNASTQKFTADNINTLVTLTDGGNF